MILTGFRTKLLELAKRLPTGMQRDSALPPASRPAAPSAWTPPIWRAELARSSDGSLAPLGQVSSTRFDQRLELLPLNEACEA